MICLVCGCQQRKTDVCVQCHAPLFAKEVKTEGQESPGEGLVPEPQVSQPPKPDPVVSKSVRSKKMVAPQSEKKVTAEKKPLSDVLVTTTQRVEGSRIAKYYGLIYTDVLIDVCESTSEASRAVMYRKQIQSGATEAMEDLRQEAALLKANAVVATTFDYQRIDSKTLLLSVIGTAVFLKDH